MLDFNKYLMRHGECWMWEFLKGLERRNGIRIAEDISLEERWDFVMNDVPPTAHIQHAIAA